MFPFTEGELFSGPKFFKARFYIKNSLLGVYEWLTLQKWAYTHHKIMNSSIPSFGI